MRYPIEMKPDGEGWFVSFPDIPEALTSGATREEALEMAEDALLTALEFYFSDGQAVPSPSKAKKGQEVVELPASVEAKVMLLNAMAAQQIRPTELARRMGVTRQEINRLTNLQHATKIDTLAAAFKALGQQLQLSVAPA